MAALPVPRRAAWGAPEAAGRALVPREVFFGNPDVASRDILAGFGSTYHDTAPDAFVLNPYADRNSPV